MTRPRKTVFAALALVIGTTIAVYSVEIVFRNVLLVPFVPESQSDFRKTVSDHWPEHVALEKKAGTIRILGLADSFGVAGGPSNFHYRLGEILRERGYDIEIVNFSVAAYSLEHELALLKRFGADYDPDLVLQSFFVGNDFGLGEPPSSRYGGISITTLSGPASWLPKNLALARWIPKRWRVQSDRRRKEAGGSLSQAVFLGVERVRFSTCLLPKGDGPAWYGTTAVLDELRRAVLDMGAAQFVVVHPDQFQVEAALADEIVATYALNRKDYDLDLPQKFMQAYSLSRGQATLDLTPAMRAAGSAGGFYLLRDTHYNLAGNELAAGALADALEPAILRIQARLSGL